MIGLIVTGHGHFATGLTTSLNLIAGDAKDYVAVDFEATDSTDDLAKKLTDARMPYTRRPYANKRNFVATFVKRILPRLLPSLVLRYRSYRADDHRRCGELPCP